MATIGVSCAICSEFYKNTDTIYSTNCGHVFHEHCLRQWQSRSSYCPTCRYVSSQGHKIYLNYEDGSNEYEKKIAELKSQLEESLLHASVLQKGLDDSERDFLNIQKQFSEHEESTKNLDKQIEYLTLQNEGRVKEIESKTIEIHRLQEALNASSPQGTCAVLQEEINVLKEKIQHISLKLTKEIRNSTELAVDKVKLQSMLEHATNSLKNSKERNQNNNKQCTETDRAERPNNALNRQLPRNRGCLQSIVIKNINGTFTEEHLMRKYVMKLAELVSITLKDEDIQHVSIMECKNNEKVSLLVKFANLSAKVLFLSNKSKLKQHVDTKDLVIYEYVADNTNSLFHHAKSLKAVGYKHVYCKNNRVFVRKDDKAVPVRIERREDVDQLKQKANKCEVEEPTAIVAEREQSSFDRSMDLFLKAIGL